MATYNGFPQSDGSFQIEGIDYVFQDCTDISETAVVGARYFDPNTGKPTAHPGQTEYGTLTLTAIVSQNHTPALKRAFKSPTYKDGSKVAIHTIGGISTKLLKVKISSFSFGAFNKLSNDAAMLTLTIDFSDTIDL